jgi:hypothetical protein
MARLSQSAATEAAGARAAAARMPTAMRVLVLAALGLIVTGAAYLIAVRGEALLLDLAAVSQRIFCF